MKVTDSSLEIRHSRDRDINGVNFPSYQAIVARHHTRKIKKLYDEGLDMFQVSHVMKVRLATVKSVWPQKMGKPRNNAG
jgi:hypothetical protein